uniref:TSA: Wollemia nobilis Ref_Wollemi_Transcript_29196_928 transcribed RNA sequence n=1 Tax=Wollemia nobilis TaxID=56998 RepID=A0A0C9RFX4_9CONI
MGKECLYHPSLKDRLKRPYQTEQRMGMMTAYAQGLHMKSRVTIDSESSHCSVASSRNSVIDMCFDKLAPCQDVSGKPVDDAQSSYEYANGGHNAFSSEEDVAAEVHEVELYAYVSVLRVLYASGPLSWDQEVLLTNLRLSLNVSNDEHLRELRRLFSTQSM